MNLPNDTGFYLWYICDLGYMNVGLVQVISDSSEHQMYLSLNPSKQFYLYDAGPHRVLTMYYQAHDHLPPMTDDFKPIVDGWIPFDFRTVGLIPEPVQKIKLQRIPRR